jgi:SulP family sulfate permease
VLLATFLLVVFRDLTEGILVGFAIGALLFLHRMAQAVEVEHVLADPDRPDAEGGRPAYDPRLASDRNVVVCRISGAFFFGAAAGVAAALDRTGEHPKAYVLDMAGVPFLDSTGAATIDSFVRKAARRGARVVIAGASRPVRRNLLIQGLRPPRVRYRGTLADALAAVRPPDALTP